MSRAWVSARLAPNRQRAAASRGGALTADTPTPSGWAADPDPPGKKTDSPSRLARRALPGRRPPSAHREESREEKHEDHHQDGVEHGSSLLQIASKRVTDSV
jgi:hypothetical protein